MCTPLALGIVSGVMSAAQAVVGYQAQKQEAASTKAAAEQAWAIDQNQITQRQMQEEDALRQKQQDQNIQEAEVKASAKVGAIAGGVSGLSVDNIISDVGRQASRNRLTEETNYRNIASQLQMQRQSANAQSRINSAPKPSGLSLVAGIGGSVIEGFNSYNRFRMA